MNDREKLGKRVIKRGWVSVYSDVLDLTFTCKTIDPRSRRLEMMVSNLEWLALNPKRAR
jgi:hypothetical protein